MGTGTLARDSTETRTMFIGSFICLIALIWMVTRIWKDSAGLAIASLLFWPALILALFKYWGDEENDIKVPFMIFVPAAIYMYYDWMKTAAALREQQESMLGILTPFA